MLAKFDNTPYFLPSIPTHLLHTRWGKLNFLGKKKVMEKLMKNTNPPLRNTHFFSAIPITFTLKSKFCNRSSSVLLLTLKKSLEGGGRHLVLHSKLFNKKINFSK